jgi:hypothetical protein
MIFDERRAGGSDSHTLIGSVTSAYKAGPFTVLAALLKRRCQPGRNCILDKLMTEELRFSPEEMGLSKADKDWIEAQHREAHASAGWRVARILKDWGIVGACITGALALLGIAITSVGFAVSESKANSEFRGRTSARLDAIELSIRAARAALRPENPKDQNEAKAVLQEAKNRSIPVPREVVEQAGISFLRAATDSSSSAWPVALDYVSYRSTLNPTVVPQDRKPFVSGQTVGSTEYQIHPVVIDGIEKPKPYMEYLSVPPRIGVPQAEAARVESLDKPPLQTASIGVHTFVLEGGAIDLEDMHLRRAILIGVEVHYNGGPVLLENVTFVACHFVMNNTPNARGLAEQVLASEEVKFHV